MFLVLLNKIIYYEWELLHTQTTCSVLAFILRAAFNFVSCLTNITSWCGPSSSSRWNEHGLNLKRGSASKSLNVFNHKTTTDLHSHFTFFHSTCKGCALTRSSRCFLVLLDGAPLSCQLAAGSRSLPLSPPPRGLAFIRWKGRRRDRMPINHKGGLAQYHLGDVNLWFGFTSRTLTDLQSVATLMGTIFQNWAWSLFAGGAVRSCGTRTAMCWQHSLHMLDDVNMIASSSHRIFSGCTSQMCSIGLTSCDFGCQGSTLNSLSCLSNKRLTHRMWLHGDAQGQRRYVGWLWHFSSDYTTANVNAIGFDSFILMLHSGPRCAIALSQGRTLVH